MEMKLKYVMKKKKFLNLLGIVICAPTLLDSWKSFRNNQ